MTSPANPLANLLPNSTTKILTATYVPLTDPATTSTSGKAITKAGFIGSLRLQPGEVDTVLKTLAPEGAAPSDNLPRDMSFWSLLREFEGTPLASQLPPPSAFVDITPSDLTAFGDGLVTVRQQAVQHLQQATSGAGDNTNVKTQPTTSAQNLGAATDLLNTAVVQLGRFVASAATSQIGMLNLERLEMTPAGIERGGLLATIPLAPKEHTFVVQKEWSVTTQEFTSIVTDSLENYSETGVTENTQLTQATSSQVAHNNQYNVTASASGGVNFVVASGSASGSTSFGSQDQNSQSANTSRQNAVQTTRQASSRVKESHKISISTTTITGTSEATTRKLENPSATDAMRIDYFSMMRKWYVALYRYGLRLTYDITVPEPGAALREIYAKLQNLQNASNNVFTFPIKHSDITAEVKPGDSEPYYLVLADKYGVDVPPPPGPSDAIHSPGPPTLVQTGAVNFSSTSNLRPVQFSVPPGCWISAIIYESYVGANVAQSIIVQGGNGTALTANPGNFGLDLCQNQTYLWHQSGQQSIMLLYQSSPGEAPGEMFFTVECVPTDTAVAQWQSTVWSALYSAAQSQFYAQQQAINARITALQNQINNVDTLTLRREENDEIMKCVLRWLLGPGFAFMPASVEVAFMSATKAEKTNGLSSADDLKYGIDFTGNQTGLSNSQWTTLAGQEALISFINEAIEWENVVFFLYSYFWDEPLCWDFIRQIQHNDKTRQAFLRAGSARVILTVRQGWELLWANFVNTGQTTLPAVGSPSYLTIAKQIEAYDSTNYPGIPPANPDGGGLIDDDTPQVGTTCSTNIQPSTTNPSTTPVNIPVADVSGFVAGATAIIDNWDAGLDPNSPSTSIGPGGQVGIGAQENQTITAVNPPNIPVGGASAVPGTITVQGLQYSHTGPFPVVQSGAKGVLIGEWFEYTPTSGTDIQVTVNPTGPYA